MGWAWGEGMPQDRNHDRKAGQAALIRATLGAAFVLGVCAHSSVALAGDSDQSFISSFMQTLGLSNPDQINYSERSPLVVPPTRDLPPPGGVAAAPSNPDWPKDPDFRRRAAAKAKKDQGYYGDYVIDSSRPLRPDELNHLNGVPARRGGVASGGGSADPSGTGYHPKPKSIFSFDWFHQKDEYATFTGEPARTSLTDPPPGYRTPSPDEPYGTSPERKEYKIPTIASRQEPTR
jgi:hypothetical protein